MSLNCLSCAVLDDEDDEKEVVNLELWFSKPDVKYNFKCQQIRESNELAARCVCVLLT